MNRKNRAHKILSCRGVALVGMVFVALIAKTAQAQTDFFAPAGVINDGDNNSFIFNVSGLDSYTTDVNLTLNLTHDWDTDLNIYLLSPTGQRLLLFNGNGSGIFDSNFTDTVFTDAGSTPIVTGTGGAPFTGFFLADGSLLTLTDNGFDFTTNISTFSGFANSNPNGGWVLQINDVAPGDQGSLLSTTKLTLTASSSAIPEPGTLSLLALGMSAGSGALLRRRKK
jgi:subtilisin-like proprotein convertase family protein